MAILAKIGAVFAIPFLMVASHFMGGYGMASTTASSSAYAEWRYHATASSTASSTIKYVHSHPILPPDHAYDRDSDFDSDSATHSTGAAISLSPVTGPVGTTVTVTGTGFTSSSTVHFGPGVIHDAQVSADGTSISFTIPNSVGPYCPGRHVCPLFMALLHAPGTYQVYVQTGASSTATTSFDLTGTTGKWLEL